MSVESTVLGVAGSLVAAFGRHDTAAYFACFAPDATFVFHNHPERLTSRAAYEDLWQRWETDHGFRVRACLSSGGAVQVVGDGVAIFTHDVVTETEFDGERTTGRERETIVFRRDGDAWTAVHEHLSPDPAEPA